MNQINQNSYFLINSHYEFKLATNYIENKNITNFKLIATSKQAISECLKKKVAFESIESFTSNEELIELGYNNINLLSGLINYADNFLSKEITELRKLQIKPFKFNQLKLKILIDTSTSKILNLKNFLEKSDALKGDIYLYVNSESTLFDNNGLLDENANLYSLIINQFQIKDRALFKIGYFLHSPYSLYNSNFNVKKNSLFKKYKNLIKRIFNYFNEKNKSYVIFDYGHDIKHIEHQLLKKKYKKFFILEASNFKDYFYKDLWKKMLNDKSFKSFFSFNEISYFEIVKNILKIFIEDEIPRSIIAYKKNLKNVENSNIKFALTGSINVGTITRSSMLALQKKNIPIVTYTEGGAYGQIISPHHHSEFSDGDVLFCYGRGNQEYIKNLNLKDSKQVVVVGSINQRIIFDKLKTKNLPNKINSIMFSSTVFRENALVAPYNGLGPGLSFLSQMNVIKYLNSIRLRVDINIKPHPQDKTLIEILKTDEFADLNYVEGKQEDKLENIDLFILDWPATTLLEVIGTNSYVFLLKEKNAFKLTEEQEKLLDKRVYVFHHLDEMKKAIDLIINNIKLYPIKLDNSFLRNYSFDNSKTNQLNNVFDELTKLMNRNDK